MKKLITVSTFATLIASPAFVTPVDAVTAGAALFAAIAGIVLVRHEVLLPVRPVHRRESDGDYRH
jgi:hypothetical protein